MQAKPRPPLRSLSRERSLDLVLLYDDTSQVRRGLALDALPDADSDSMAPVIAALETLGYRVRGVGVSYDDLSPLDDLEADVVFHMADGNGLDGNPGLEVPIALERRGLHFCGAGSAFYHATVDKLALHGRLAAARVPSPLSTVLSHPEARLPACLGFPLIVKPRDGFGSIGISTESVVHTPTELRRQVERLTAEIDCDALVAQFVPGRELTVGVIGRGAGAFTLPPLETEFGEAYRHIPKIKTYQTKFDVESALYHDFRAVCPARLEPSVEQRVRQVALRAYRALGGDGYGRVDIRLARDGTPYVIEVNAQPSLEDGESMADCAMLPLIGRGAGWTYPELLRRILATARTHRPTESRRSPVFAPRWHAGRTSVHAMCDLPAHAALCPLGDVQLVPEPRADGRCLRLVDGRAVRIGPDVRHVEHASEPSLLLVPVGDAPGAPLLLVTSRAVAAGEALTLDRDAPLPLSVLRRRPRAHGQRGAHPALAAPLQQVG